jgi:hypothetical protein
MRGMDRSWAGRGGKAAILTQSRRDAKARSRIQRPQFKK